ncbi:hypothetical protein GQX73_g1450 [Xylaria multiplex]|uniref:DRBM domain-containing protein n=1 Tax=Xylaria multiplex TaxID=323545 RepID=A0A7C8ITT4_9PEZI|nr:hypothetical protein GQX73_g1450 [Xylaria multiplex]
MAATGSTVPPATYALIETWISQQRQAPAPLTDKLRTALIGLESALLSHVAPPPEPELGDQNWVGLLQGKYPQYRAAYPIGGSTEIDFVDSPYDPTGRGQVRWKCQVTIDEDPGAPFPRAGGDQLSFARKKDAKKYAAKCAVEWLRERRFMPQDGAKFPKGVVAPHKQQPALPKSQQSKASSISLAKGQSPPQTKPPSPPTNIPSSPYDDSEPSAAHQVSVLCGALGIPPPRYDVESVNDGFYRGRADFGAYSGMLPFDASEPTPDAISKKTAKEMVAEYLLKHLQAEKQKRDREKEAFLAQYEGGSKD